MTIQFERPIGAHRDVKELQYLSALHQTGQTLRPDATVTAEDVVHFLMSRHGIQADMDFVKEHLMPGLAGALGDNPVAVFDIVEIVSILLIPYLKNEREAGDPENVFGKVLGMILKDATGSVERPFLERTVMRNILESYGEFGVPLEVIDEMLVAAGAIGEDPARLDADMLMKACTSDLVQYDSHWDKTPTTHYYDVFHGTTLDADEDAPTAIRGSATQGLSKDLADEEGAKSKFDGGGNVKRVYTAPSIDGIAENYNSKTFITVLWVLVVVVYFTYILNLTSAIASVECERFKSEFACKVVNSIVAWLLIFAQLSVLGFAMVFLASAGNSIYSSRTVGAFLYLLVGMATVICTTILAFVYEFKFYFVNTRRSEDDFIPKDFQYYVILILGIILLFYQVKALLFFLVPQSAFSAVKLSFFASLLVPGMAKSEKMTKQAASFKMAKMVNDAVALHEGTLAGSSLRSSTKRMASANDEAGGTEVSGFGDALLNFHATVDDRESYGGVIWCWKSMWKGTIWSEEGVWIHARLYAMNFTQLFVGILFIIVYVLFYTSLKSLFDPVSDSEETSVPTFSPSSSPAPSPAFFQLSYEDMAILYFLPLIDDLIKQYLVNDFAYGNFSETLWSNVDEGNATEFVSSILNGLPSDVLSYLVQNLETDTLQILSSALSGDASNLDNGTSSQLGNITRFRMLQSISPSPSAIVYNFTNFTDDFVSTDDDGASFFDDLTPKKWEVAAAVTVGGVCAVAAAVSLFIIWIPSAVATILQFRSGVIGSLRDKDFVRYRAAPDTVGVLFGSTFWGALFASAALFVLVGAAVFFCVYHVTAPYFILILATLIGVMVTIVFKVIILLCLRKVLFAGFYRRSPLFANCLMVVMECWNLALTVLAMVQRLVKLLLVAAFYVGRLDTPMLAKGVGNIGPIPLDDYPIQFRKDLLLHEAHRHPYMERLGVMYMLKLRHGDDFASRAGSAWRLIFVMALMPWLRRFRVDEDDEGEVVVSPEQRAIDRINAKRNELSHAPDEEESVTADDDVNVTATDNSTEEEKAKLKNENNLLRSKLHAVKEYLRTNASDIVDTIVWEIS